MKEKKGGAFLRWPWNIVVYLLLVAVLRLLAIPVIMLLIGLQRKNNPHGAEEGYCLSRTRQRLFRLIWALLVLLLSAGMLVMLIVGLKHSRTDWGTTDYVILVSCGIGGPLFLLGGFLLACTAIRDAFFPAQSALAKSIRNQLPYPEEAPPAEELFAMVDRDLEENGQWFGPVGVGREWVLGDEANRIGRIRGIFTVNELRRNAPGAGPRNVRSLELVLVDDRWKQTRTTFRDLKDLQAAAECLSLRVPEARRGDKRQLSDFWSMDEIGREAFEREFQQKRNRRATEAAQREALSGGPQDMILKRRGGDVTSRVTPALVTEILEHCLKGEETGFELTPTRPVSGGGRTFRSLDCLIQEESAGEPKVLLLLEISPSGQEENLALALTTDPRRAEEILQGWLRREVPELTGWELRRLYVAPQPAQPRRASQAKLALVYASGAAETHTTFTEEDVQAAAEGIVDGTYQIADLTHPSGYMWIRVTAGDRTDGRCTVEATRPEGQALALYITKMPPKEAAAWLTGYPRGEFLPGVRDWKRVPKSK